MTGPGSPTERVRAAYRSLADARRPDVWITVRPRDDAMRAAETVERRLAAGEDLPLAGTVVAVKDNVDVVGLPTTAAHPRFARRPERSATAVQRLVDAGAVVLGKTNMDQFATGLTGTRSPYGVVRSATAPGRVAGGSSSGSAVAVALGIADVAVATDTAGSGRVPAAFNRLVGVKPTLGLVPKDGVVPACHSYDCVSVLAPTLAAATRSLAVMTGPAAEDPSSRGWPAGTRLAAPEDARVAVPDAASLAVLVPEVRARFAAARARLEAHGVRTGEIDLAPFLAGARLLYGGALVAERHAAFGDFLAAHPAEADPSVAFVATHAAGVDGSSFARDLRLLAELRREAMAGLDGYDALLLPTAPDHPTPEEVAADPLAVNSRLGTFTNAVNLFDLAAVAVPAGTSDAGEFGVSVVVRAFDDQVALDLAGLLVDERAPLYPTTGVPLVVFGAHLRGEPLNGQLHALGARFVGDVVTAPAYAMYALAGGAKPVVVPVGDGGSALPGEEWLLSPAALGTFLAALPAPMALGPVALADGRHVVGFTGATTGTETDITAHGGWRAYRRVAAGSA